MHSTRDPGRDLHIPPGILYPSYENIVLLFFKREDKEIKKTMVLYWGRT